MTAMEEQAGACTVVRGAPPPRRELGDAAGQEKGQSRMELDPVFEAVLNHLRRRKFPIWETEDGRKYRTQLLNYAIYLTGGDRDSAEDLVQEATYLQFVKQDLHFPTARHLNAWFRTVIRHKFLDGNRRKTTASLDKLIGDPEDGDNGSQTLADQIAAAMSTEGEVMTRKLRALAEELPDKEKPFTIGRIFEGYTVEELAKQYNCSVAAAWRRANKGARLLWTKWEGMGK